MTSPSKPTIILLPGAWHPPTVFTPLIKKLSDYGYKCIPLPLQATDQSEAVPSLQKDLDILHQTASKCIDEGEDVMVVGHSWSGLIAGGGLDGLAKKQRETEGKKNGVIRIAYLCAFCPVENVSLIEAFAGEEPEFYDVQVSFMSYSLHICWVIVVSTATMLKPNPTEAMGQSHRPRKSVLQ